MQKHKLRNDKLQIVITYIFLVSKTTHRSMKHLNNKSLYFVNCILLQFIHLDRVMGETLIHHDILKSNAFNNTPKYWFKNINQFLYNVIERHDLSVDIKFFVKSAKNL